MYMLVAVRAVWTLNFITSAALAGGGDIARPAIDAATISGVRNNFMVFLQVDVAVCQWALEQGLF